MSKLALREFLRNIEDLISQKKSEKAIAFCASIFEKYPKNLAVYRLLGKAFLEANKLDFAEKVFGIILKIDPDDFVSHIGRSFTSETKNDLEGAVDAMLRAFELQPSNEMLQNEVKRLYKVLNGVEPQKVRLTRGSLIKMYMNGKLYDQAAGEIHVGIHESPNRIDYKINLAECEFNLGNHIKAVEVAVDVLRTLPYSMKANEIIDRVISADSEKQKDNLSRKRLIELDPYFQYMQPTTSSILDVPDIAVIFEMDTSGSMDNFDWEEQFSKTWEEKSDNTFPSPEIIAELSESSGHSETFLPKNPENAVGSSVNDINSSKKERFIAKLQKRTEIRNLEEAIPDWIFDEREKEPAQEIEIPVDDEDLSALTIHEIENSLPGNDEDYETENLNKEFDSKIYHDEWHAESVEKEHPSDLLSDTQRLLTNVNNYEDRLIEAQKAIVGENIQHAKQIFSELIQDDMHLEKTILALDGIVKNNPSLSELKHLLGQAYLKAGLIENANMIFLDNRKKENDKREI